MPLLHSNLFDNVINLDQLSRNSALFQATDAFEEVFYDSFLEEFVIAPVVAEQSREIIKDVCDNYNNKKRRADLRLVRYYLIYYILSFPF